MDRSRLGVLFVWPVLLALILGQGVLFVRLGRIEAAVREARVPERTPRRATPAAERPIAGAPPRIDEPAALSGPPRAVEPARSGPVGTPVPLAQAQIEDAVRRILEEREKESPVKVAVQRFEDPVTLLERELRLSPSQKEQLLRLRKERSTALQDLGRSELRKSHPDVWRAQNQSVEEIYQARVRNLLDTQQQGQYDALRTSGRLWDSGSGWGGRVMYTVDQNGAPSERNR